MSVCRPPLLVPTSGDFKSAAADDCGTSVATQPSTPPSQAQSVSIQLSSPHLHSEVEPAEQKLHWVSSAWSALISVLFVSMFPCFLLLRGSKTVFLISLTSHNALHCHQWELSLFPALSTTAAIFPMLPFQGTYLGHWGHQTSSGWKNNTLSQGKNRLTS